jgi:hypothetical protein
VGAQLNVYLYLLRHDSSIQLPPITTLEVVAMVRDYGPRHAAELKQVEIINIPIWPDEQIEAYMRDRVRLHQEAMRGETVPLECTPEERWEDRKGISKRCEGYCPFQKQQLCPYRS